MIKAMRLINSNGPGTGFIRPLDKRTRSLVDAFMMAAKAGGDPSNWGKGGPAGYFKFAAANQPRAFLRLLAQILLLQTTNQQHQGSLDSPIGSLFEAIVMAPEAVGDPSNRGKGGAAGYFKWVLAKHPRVFFSLWPHILPLQMINERSEKECAQIKELLVEKMLRKIVELRREKLEKLRTDQDRINATAPLGGVGQRPRLTKSNADQDCFNAPAREAAASQRSPLTESRADQDGINGTAPQSSSRTSAAARLNSKPAHSRIPVHRSAAGDSLDGTVAACRYLCEL